MKNQTQKDAHDAIIKVQNDSTSMRGLMESYREMNGPVEQIIESNDSSSRAKQSSDVANKLSAQAEKKNTVEAHLHASKMHAHAWRHHENAMIDHGDGPHASYHDGVAMDHGDKSDEHHDKAEAIQKKNPTASGARALKHHAKWNSRWHQGDYTG